MSTVDTETGEILVEEITTPAHTQPDPGLPENHSRHFATPYTHRRSRSRHFATVNAQESMTQQSDKDDADINILVKKFKGGQIPQRSVAPMYGDFTSGDDYRAIVEKVNAADAAFRDLPADVRGRFMNDPARFMDFVHDEKNLDELRKLGLAVPAKEPAPPPEPMLVKVVPDLPPGVPREEAGPRPGTPR